MGATHYVTNDNAANHLFAGVKKLFKLGILRSLNGRAFTIEFPASTSAGPRSGVTFYVRREEGTLTPNSYVPVLYDVNIG